MTEFTLKSLRESWPIDGHGQRVRVSEPLPPEDGVDLPATLDAIRSLQEEIEGRKTNVEKLETWLADEREGLSKARDLLKIHKQRLARELANLTGDE